MNYSISLDVMKNNLKTENSFLGFIGTALSKFIGILMTPFKLLFLFLLSSCLPARGKRMLMITSLWCLIFNTDSKEQQEALKRLNGMFTMADDPGALQLPALLHHALWNERTVHDCVGSLCPTDERSPSDADIQAASIKILDITPKWLRYGRRDDMIRDISVLLSGGRGLRT